MTLSNDLSLGFFLMISSGFLKCPKTPKLIEVFGFSRKF